MMENLIIILDFISKLISENYFQSLLIYFFVLILYFSLSLPGSTILILSSGFFFGFYIGFFINIISVSFGSLIFYIFFQKLFKKLFQSSYEKSLVNFSKIIKNSSYEYLILLRLVFGPPLLIQNICISFLNISKFKLLFTTFVGFMPLFLLFSYMGNKFSNIIELKNFKLNEIITFDFILIIIILILLVILRVIFKKKPSI